MKKSVKRIISLALCLVMAAGILCTGASAECSLRYVHIGDSTSMGYLLNDYHYGDREVYGSSAYSVYSMMINYLEECWKLQNVSGKDLSLLGARPIEYRAILDEDYYSRYCDGSSATDMNYCDHHIDQYIAAFTDRKTYAELHDAYTQAIAEADLITLDLIMADMKSIFGAISNPAKYFNCKSYAEMLALEGHPVIAGLAEELRSTLEGMLDGLGLPAGDVTELIDGLQRIFYGLCSNYSDVMDIIYGLNPDVNMIVIGPYNAFEGYVFSIGGIELEFGAIWGVVQSFIESYAIMLDSHSWRYRYADCPDKLGLLQDSLAAGEFERYSEVTDRLLSQLLGNNYAKAYTPEKIEEMKSTLAYACSIRTIPLDVVANNAGDYNKAILWDDPEEVDFAALGWEVLQGLANSAGFHPNEPGYVQKFESVKQAFVSPVAANGTYLTRIIDGSVGLVFDLLTAVLGSRTSITKIFTAVKKLLTPVIHLQLKF